MMWPFPSGTISNVQFKPFSIPFRVYSVVIVIFISLYIKPQNRDSTIFMRSVPFCEHPTRDKRKQTFQVARVSVFNLSI